MSSPADFFAPESLLTPVLTAFFILLALVILARVTKVDAGPERRTESEILGEPEVEGTVFVEDDEGHVVRRSTRARKPIEYGNAPPTPSKTPKKTPTKATRSQPPSPAPATRTPAISTPRATRTKAAEPAAVTPVTTRSKRTPRA